MINTSIFVSLKSLIDMIEVSKKIKVFRNSYKPILVVNGIEDIHAIFTSDSPVRINISDQQVLDIVLAESFRDVGPQIAQFSFTESIPEWEEKLKITVTCNEYYNVQFPRIVIDLSFLNWDDWNRPYSMFKYAHQFENYIIQSYTGKTQYWEWFENSVISGFGIECLPSDDTLIIGDVLEQMKEVLKVALEYTNAAFKDINEAYTLLTYFKFPSQINAACKQYIIYFSQFMADLGIEINTELKDELDHTLFKIIPQNKTESLQKIKEALHVYLTAAGQEDFLPIVASQNNYAVKQWEANVYHLKSQLALAQSMSEARQATIRAHEATIESLELANYQYKQILKSNETSNSPNQEGSIPGIVTLKKYEGMGGIDLTELFRKMRRHFNK